MKGTLQQLKYALNSLGEYKATTLYQLRYNCPSCEKNGSSIDKYNLEVSFKKNRFHCWACGDKGTLDRLIKKYGAKEFAELFEEEDRDPLTGFLEKKKLEILEMPRHTISVFKKPEILKYLLEERGLTKEIILQRGIKYCFEGPYKGNILFPSYNLKGSLTALCLHNFETKKYRNRKGEGFICFYESFIDLRSPIIITEGVYDALSVPNAIPLLGLGMGLNKQMLEFLNNANVIVALDALIANKIKDKIIKQLESVCKVVSVLNVSEELEDLNYAYVNNSVLLKSKIQNYYIENY